MRTFPNLCISEQGLFTLDGQKRLRYSAKTCRSGEIGRRTGLKIQQGQPYAGSTPASGTMNNLKRPDYPGQGVFLFLPANKLIVRNLRAEAECRPPLLNYSVRLI